ncbi:unnamed protein product [Cylindrotheca closterium]|uniref:EF-hand domain-containing protein n=1 Tax=Cylindrotheca closterium TaxID=2856 RepID=A0AAD2G3M3_9STRA|nr:unnamed protein product [Cylindrotheca closterium]
MADEAKEETPPQEEVPDVEAQDSKPASKPADAATPAAEGGEENCLGGDKVLTPVTMGVLGICGAMVGLYLAAMGIWGGAVVTVAGLVAIIVGGLVSKFQYFDLESLETLRTVHNGLRASVNDFSAENTKLVANNDRLEEEIVPLKECEEKLSAIAEQSGSDVKKLTGLVAENQKTLDTMHEIQKQDTVQSLMQILMEADRDEDGELTDREVKRLMNKMKNLPAVNFNEERFERKLENHRQLSTFLTMVHEVNDESVPKDDRIFTVSEDPKEVAMEE